MENKQKNNKLFEGIKQNPAIVKLTSGGIGGAITLVIINKTTGFLDEINFNNIIEWISKLKSYIQGSYAASIIIIIIICLFIYKLKKLKEKGIFYQKVLDIFGSSVKQDNAITSINIKNENDNTNISINIERNNDIIVTNETDNNNVINFQQNVNFK